MGIAYCLIRAAPEVVEQLRGHPKAVADFVYRDPEAYEEPGRGIFGRLFGTRPPQLAVIPSRRENDEADLDKSWHIVHYLLTGETGRAVGPLRLIGDDLNPLADIDLGLGKPNVVSVADVKAFALATETMSDDDFLRRFKPAEMPTDELYMGDVIARGDHDDMKEYALENFHALRDFVAGAAHSDDAIITYYS